MDTVVVTVDQGYFNTLDAVTVGGTFNSDGSGDWVGGTDIGVPVEVTSPRHTAGLRITEGWQPLSFESGNGPNSDSGFDSQVWVSFASKTGHTVGDRWEMKTRSTLVKASYCATCGNGGAPGLTCRTPRATQQKARVNVEITNNMIDFTSGGHSFSYDSAMTVSDLFPSRVRQRLLP
jgi:hypothetical protein